MNIIILGKPGSGKGTQAELLEKHFFHASAGDFIREEVKKGTPLGKRYNKIIANGNLLPDKEVTSLVLKKTKGRKNIMFDGFPRTIEQAILLEKNHIKIDKVIYIKVPDKVIISRLSKRMTCEKCGAVFHQTVNPPKKKGVCDFCKGKLYVRDDDKPNVVRNRLRIYNKETKPLIDYYRRKKILYEVDGNKEIKVIHRDIIKILKSF